MAEGRRPVERSLVRAHSPALAMIETPPQVEADAVVCGAVSKDGVLATIEFAAGDQRIWVTIPVSELGMLEKLCLELRSLGVDAKNGVASHWHIATLSKAQGPCSDQPPLVL